MDKHKCKLCFKSFSNGRALGGHMRSHMLSLPIPPKPDDSPPPRSTIQLSFEAELSPSSSSSEEEGDEDKNLSYLLRNNPKRSFRLVDPEFSFAADTGSVILQDRESETESKNPTKRRSKRTWKVGFLEDQYINHKKIEIQDQQSLKKVELSKHSYKIESWGEPEPASSISDTTTDENVAFCLMMLSRDKWKRKNEEEEEDEDDDDEEEEEDEEDEEAEKDSEDSEESEEQKLPKNRARGKYKCETCKKVFRSYQALGGHRASHKKIKLSHTSYHEAEFGEENNNARNSAPMADSKKIHECPVCFRVFSSGQALGGHKRTHVIATPANPARNSRNKFEENLNLIDLNLPAPVDDDEISQIENSAVSDGEFVRN